MVYTVHQRKTVGGNNAAIQLNFKNNAVKPKDHNFRKVASHFDGPPIKYLKIGFEIGRSDTSFDHLCHACIQCA